MSGLQFERAGVNGQVWHRPEVALVKPQQSKLGFRQATSHVACQAGKGVLCSKTDIATREGRGWGEEGHGGAHTTQGSTRLLALSGPSCSGQGGDGENVRETPDTLPPNPPIG